MFQWVLECKKKRQARQILSHIVPDKKWDSSLKKYLLGVSESFRRVWPNITEKTAKNQWGKEVKLLSGIGTRKNDIYLNTTTKANYLRYEVWKIMTFYYSIPFKTTIEGENLTVEFFTTQNVFLRCQFILPASFYNTSENAKT